VLSQENRAMQRVLQFAYTLDDYSIRKSDLEDKARIGEWKKMQF